jgi:Protein of unknown function (DUF4238)
MAGRRHHTIPQFMLRAFESSRRGNELKVWCYRRDSEPIELNITKIGVEKDFYGKELDERITELENHFAPVAHDLRKRSGPVDEPEIADLVAHLILRTRALRQSAVDLARKMTERTRDHLSQPDVIKAAVDRRMPRSEILKRLRNELAKAGMSRIEIERRILAAGPKLFAIWEQNLDDGITAIVPVANRAMSESAKGLPASMRLSFIDALSRGLEDNPRIKAYRQVEWSVLPTAESLILGDSVCVFEVEGERPFKPWDDETTPAKRIFMPLCPRRLLVGSRKPSDPEVDITAINEAFARCSLEFFVSPKRLDGSDLIECIGVWSGIASDTELNAVWEQIKADL